MDRRRYLRSVLVGGLTGVAGCSGVIGGSGDGGGSGGTTAATSTAGDGPPGTTSADGSLATTTTSNATTTGATGERVVAEAPVGGRIDAGDLGVTVREPRYRDSLDGDEFGDGTTPGEGNEFLVVRPAVKNTTDGLFLDFPRLVGVRLLDDGGVEYQSTQSRRRPFGVLQLAPGEVTQGDLAFEVPTDASLSLELEFEDENSDTLGLDVALERAVFDLSTDRSPPADLPQTLGGQVHREGDRVTGGGVEVTLDGVETATSLGEYEADPGNEYVVVDVSVTNDTGEGRVVPNYPQQVRLKDGDGFNYPIDATAEAALDPVYPRGRALPDGERHRGQLVYQVPQGTAPLFWTFDFLGGDKAFWTVR